MPTKVDTDPQAKDFANLVNLMSVYAEASTRMGQLTNTTQSDYLDLVDATKAEYAALQETLMKAEAALEVVARSHPEWFEEAKSITTPFGKVAFRAATKLEVKNEELTIVLIQQRIEAEAAQADESGQTPPSKAYLRETISLNLEALEKLDDKELARLKIARVTDDSFSVTPLKINLGKAVKDAAKKEKKAGKAVAA